MDRKRFGAASLAALLVVACTGASPTPPPTQAPTPAAATEAPATEAPATEAPATEGPATGAPATDPPATEGPVAESCTGQQLRFILSFIPNVQHAGFLVAANRGYYEDEGVNVEIVPAGPNVDPVSSVGDGSAQLGQVDYGQLLRARAAGVPIKSIAQTYQRSFLNWYATKESGIATIEDWAGKRVGQIQVGEEPEIRLMLAQVGMTPDDVQPTQQDFGIEDFMAGDVDVGTGVVFFHPASFNGQTELSWPDDFNIWTPDDNGAPISSQTVAANEEILQSDPQALRCFLRASIRGWQATLADPDAAVDDVMAFIPEGAIPRDHQAAAIHDVLPIVAEGPDDPMLLRIDPDRYVESISLLESIDYFEGDPPPVEETYDASILDTMGPVPAP